VTIGRRHFIGIVAGAAAGAAVGFPGGKMFQGLLASANSSYDPPRGPEQFILSVCTLCPGGCGIRARRIGERVVKVDGNPLHPISGGRLCPKGQAAIQSLYHPDRVRVPLRRFGPRGDLRSFRTANWEQALTEISSRLQMLREGRRPEGLVLLRDGSDTVTSRLASRFARAFGSPNDIVINRGDESEAMALQLTQGIRATPAYDIRSSDYILSLGSEFLEAAPSPLFNTRAYGDFRQKRAAHRGKLVQVDPRLSITASSADEWIAIRPGSHAVFALGVASVIVGEGLHNREFVGDRTVHFEDAGGLRRLLQERFPLERAAAETGVSVNLILRVARELAGAHSAVVLGPRKGPLVPGRLFDHLAARVLNALIGAIDQPGGLLVPEGIASSEWPEVMSDSIGTDGHRQPRLDGVTGRSMLSSDLEQLSEALQSGRPYSADTLLLLDTDPIYASTQPQRIAQALEHVPMTVAFSTVPSDTALHADWILPSTHFLEQWELHGSAPAVPFPLVSVAQPALAKPRGQARPPAKVILELAKRVGLQSAMPWKDAKEAMRLEIDGLFKTRRGAIIGSSFDEAWVRMMEDAGWWAPGYRTADELWQRSLEAGGWWDPFYDHGDWKRVLRTESGKFDFQPELLRQFDDTRRAVGIGDGTNMLNLILFEPLAIAGGRGAELPTLQTLLDPGHEESWETWGEIHPHTASPLGVQDGMRIRVTSGHGVVIVRARTTDRVVEGAIAIPVGLGRTGGGRWAAGVGVNPLRLVGSEREVISSLPDPSGVRVSVTVEERRTA